MHVCPQEVMALIAAVPLLQWLRKRFDAWVKNFFRTRSV
jgi:hypothetical protein